MPRIPPSGRRVPPRAAPRRRRGSGRSAGRTSRRAPFCGFVGDVGARAPFSTSIRMSRTRRPLRPLHMNTAEDNRWAALYVLCAGVLMIILDTTIVNVALPSIQADLGFSQGNLAWVVNAYLIAFGGLLMLAGRAGDLVGRRRVFVLGLAVFTAASL